MNLTCTPADEIWQAVDAAYEKRRREGGFSLGDGKPSAIITSERYHDLWQAVLARCDELKRQHAPNLGGRQSAALIDWDGRGTSAILGIVQNDGTDLVYHVEGRLTSRRDDISVSHDGPWLDSHDSFWAGQVARREGAVVIGHDHYRIKPDLPERDRGIAGYGGSLHRIRMLATGEVIETRNLWHQGTVPPKWREQMPDDAEFVTAEEAARNPYEAAAERFERASRAYPLAKAESARLLREANDEYEAAEADLRQYESQPGIPLPQDRKQAQA